jgi:hypothetical protein
LPGSKTDHAKLARDYRLRRFLIILVLASCTQAPGGRQNVPPPAVDAGPATQRQVPPPTYLDIATDRRIVAVGDVHGDIEAARRALRLAGVINARDDWSGSQDLVVQVGDQLDRGDDEKAILRWFARLAQQAFDAGGGFFALNGNHETMNVSLDFRYVTPGGWQDFADTAQPEGDAQLANFPSEQRGRTAAFRPGGPFARMLAEQNTVMVIGRNVFVHGGVLPVHFGQGLRRINEDIRAWMLGAGPKPASISSDESLVWSRHFSSETGPEECALLGESLDLAGADRMIVAHTVQSDGINSFCADRVWRVDVGLAAHYDGPTQVLEIIGDTIRIMGTQR